jgi:hypothetical protein
MLSCARSFRQSGRSESRGGSRGRSNAAIQLHTLNVSLSWARAVDYLENEAGAAIKDGLLPVVCIQEHGKTGDW